MMFVPLSVSDYEFTEKKSRFLARALRVESPDEVREKIKELRKEHPASRHVVHAFVIGKHGEIMGMSDDGEPPGTAGRPVLELIKGRHLTSVLVLVVRYFGGIKLGTGGLVRAYGQAARGALDGLLLEEQIPRRRFSLTCPYARYETLRGLIEKLDGRLFDEKFAQDVELEGALPLERAQELEKALRDLSGGKAEVRWGGEFD